MLAYDQGGVDAAFKGLDLLEGPESLALVDVVREDCLDLLELFDGLFDFIVDHDFPLQLVYDLGVDRVEFGAPVDQSHPVRFRLLPIGWKEHQGVQEPLEVLQTLLELLVDRERQGPKELLDVLVLRIDDFDEHGVVLYRIVGFGVELLLVEGKALAEVVFEVLELDDPVVTVLDIEAEALQLLLDFFAEPHF